MKYNVADSTAIPTTVRGTSTDKAYRWLHAKPSSIGPADAMVIAVAVGQNTTQNTTFS
jgi:hypothetical protein